MKKTIFISSRWIKFLLNGETCIGRTFLHDKKEKKDILNQLVILITENRKTKVINFCECIEIKYLEFVQKQAQIKDLKIILQTLVVVIMDMIFKKIPKLNYHVFLFPILKMVI